MSELDMWNLLAGFMSGNAVWFLAMSLQRGWLQNTSNVYESGQAPLIEKYWSACTAGVSVTHTDGKHNAFRDVASGLSAVERPESCPGSKRLSHKLLTCCR